MCWLLKVELLHSFIKIVSSALNYRVEDAWGILLRGRINSLVHYKSCAQDLSRSSVKIFAVIYLLVEDLHFHLFPWEEA